MTGLRDEIDGQRCITDKLIPAISNIVNDNGDSALQPYKSKLNFINYNIVLINSDFDVKFKIDRAILYDILVNKYKFYASYEPCIYPGINSKFYGILHILIKNMRVFVIAQNLVKEKDVVW